MADQPKKTYPKGMVAFNPLPTAPKFIKAAIMINPNDLYDWLGGEGKQCLGTYKDQPQLKLQLVEFNGKLSLQVDMYGVKKKEEEFNGNSDDQSDMPF